MNIALLILIVLGIICIVVSLIINFRDKCDSYLLFGCGIGITISIFAIVPIYLTSISPMDVYRGKTTLEITYKDDIPIDSVVVYKNR